MKRWTEEEYRYLKDNYNVIPIEKIIFELGRTQSSITSKIRYLRRRGWTFNRKRDAKH
jgi:biotin operon repressor|tara:strand:+ start:208 stop:381 length:174 start_codon:yes stop_codon:yes gene_type:complete